MYPAMKLEVASCGEKEGIFEVISSIPFHTSTSASQPNPSHEKLRNVMVCSMSPMRCHGEGVFQVNFPHVVPPSQYSSWQ